jgi:hypothetical protein
MLGVVDGLQLCKKYLPGGVLPHFKALLTGCLFQDKNKKTDAV